VPLPQILPVPKNLVSEPEYISPVPGSLIPYKLAIFHAVSGLISGDKVRLYNRTGESLKSDDLRGNGYSSPGPGTGVDPGESDMDIKG